MLHRITASLIVLFWLTMTGLLVVREIYPEATRLNAVPIGHVANMLFQHQQPSDLQIHGEEKEIGFFHLQPRVIEDGLSRVLETHGTTTISLPGGIAQPLSWNAVIQLDPSHQFRKLRLTIHTGEPVQQFELGYDTETRVVDYSVHSGKQLVDKSQFRLDGDGLSAVLGRMGIDPALTRQVTSGAAQFEAPQFDAQQTSLTLSGETLTTYLVTVRISGQRVAEAHISQLGQILKANLPPFNTRLVQRGIAP